MLITVIQPYYSFDPDDVEKCFSQMVSFLKESDPSSDIIVLPEYSDVPAYVKGKENFYNCSKKFNGIILDAAKKKAKECSSIVFVNAADYSDKGIRNTTYAIDRNGTVVGKYYKAHPAPSETKKDFEGGNELDVEYSYSYREPYIVTIDGLRFGFLTCYDFYFYEAFPALAKMKPDIIIGCSHQRTDTHDSLEINSRFLAYNTNSYVIRSAVSLGENSEVCGCSMVVSPEGKVLLNMLNDVGCSSVEIDPFKKYYKPAGFGGKLKSHYEYIEEGRRPWLYRPAGSMIIPGDNDLTYPRICSHRGFNTIAPENSMPAYGAAVALGAEEIEFDLWATKDGKLVSIHDSNIDRVSDGHGYVWDYTLDELEHFDFGCKKGEHFKGLKIITFEDILKKFACTTIMNVHVKIWDMDRDCDDHHYNDISDLIRKYDCEKHVYMMSGSDSCLEKFHSMNPDINICVGAGKDPWDIVDRAIVLKAQKVQLFKPYFNQEMIDKAHKNGIICNVFWSDDVEEACKFLDMGIDTILTNDYLTVSEAVRRHLLSKNK